MSLPVQTEHLPYLSYVELPDLGSWIFFLNVFFRKIFDFLKWTLKIEVLDDKRKITFECDGSRKNLEIKIDRRRDAGGAIPLLTCEPKQESDPKLLETDKKVRDQQV